MEMVYDVICHVKGMKIGGNECRKVFADYRMLHTNVRGSHSELIDCWLNFVCEAYCFVNESGRLVYAIKM